MCFHTHPTQVPLFGIGIMGSELTGGGVILYFHTHPNQVVVLYFDFLSRSREVGVPPLGGRGSLVCGVGCVASAMRRGSRKRARTVRGVYDGGVLRRGKRQI